jgi:hypothetical protein
MPVQIVVALACLALEVASYGYAAVAMLQEADSKRAHNQDGAEALSLGAWTIVVVAALLVVSGILVLLAVRPARWLAAWPQLVLAFIGIIPVALGGPTLLPAIVLPGAIFGLLMTRSARAWHGEQPDRQDAVSR